MSYVREQWDRSLAALAFVVGLISLLLGWVGTSGEAHVAGQMPYVVSGGLLGIFLLGTAAALWISADLRDEWRELHGVRTLLKAHLASGLAPGGAALDGRSHAGEEPGGSRPNHRALNPVAGAQALAFEAEGARSTHSAASST